MKKALPLLKRFSVSLLIFLLVGEIAIRLYFAVSAQDIHRATAAKDEVLGWTAKANFETIFQSDTSTFYHQLSKKLNLECFAFGMSGFGTLQEFLFLEQHIDSIQPDLLVLQMCTNDFIDNHQELALECMYEMHEKRPYLQADGKIVHQIPLSGFRQFLQYLKFPEFVYNRVRRILLNQGIIEVGESKIAAQNMAYPLFAEAVAKTEVLVKKIKELLPEGTQILIFCADAYEPQLTTIRQLAERMHIPFEESHIHRLREAAGEGKVPYHHDGVHWSPEGHGIVAKALVPKIEPLIVSQAGTTFSP